MDHTRSKELFEQAKALTPGGVHSPVRGFASVGGEPFIVDHGIGAHLIDLDGNRYIDYVCSWGPLVLGHAHPAVVAAIQSQAERGTSYGACNELEVRLAQLVIDTVPSLEMLRFVSSGTEATMSAIRLARAHTGRDKIVKLVGCYHGHADYLLVEAGSGVLTLGIPGSAGVPENITRDTLSAQYNQIDTITELFKNASNEIAAVILEPVVGNCGFLQPREGFLGELRELCTKNGALLIFDEVMTGFRVHPGGAQALYGVTPDLSCLGKVIGGGLPVGAYGGRRDILEAVAPLGPMYQAGTLSGNPLAMAAGIATLSEWLKPGVFEETSKLASVVARGLRTAAEANNIPFTADSLGTMFGFFFAEGPIDTYAGAQKADTKIFASFFQKCLERGVYFAPSTFEAGFVSAAHAGEPLDKTLSVIEEVFSEIESTC